MPGAFGRKLNSPYIWLPLCVLFLLPFVDVAPPVPAAAPRPAGAARLRRSHVFFNRGEIGVSVPLVYPVLLYLLARHAVVGFRRRAARPGRCVPHVP